MLAEYEVSGMSCEHCVNSVSNEVRALSGVSAVSVDLQTRIVTVVSDAPLPLADVARAVEEAGYDLVGHVAVPRPR